VQRDKSFFLNTYPFQIRKIFAWKIVEKPKAYDLRNKAACLVV